MCDERFLTVEEAAACLHTTTKYIYKLVYSRRIPVYRPLGGKLFFKKSELESLFENSRQPTRTELEDRASALLNGRSAK
jgi:excisionase family DNA binding protein